MNFVPALRKAIAFILLVVLLTSTNLTFALSTPPPGTLEEEKIDSQTLFEPAEDTPITENTSLKVNIDESLGLTTQNSAVTGSVSA